MNTPKFLAASALVAGAQAAIGATCTQTWPGATDSACAAGELCFDWLKEDKSATEGLKCGVKDNCGVVFTITDPDTKVETKHFGQCDGLSLFDCSTGGTSVCDDKQTFKCADWTTADGKTTTVGCAGPHECGTTVNAMTVVCTGLAGDACMTDAACDDKASLRCASEFNNQTYTFVKDTNKCAAGTVCGKAKEGSNTTIMLCYNDPATACNATTGCDKPDGDDGDVACGYLAPGATPKNMSSGMCVDKKFCPDAALNGTGANVTYFGADTMLWCGSARTALAMGAAAISAYLAM